jgi:hypothetical protein
VSTVLAKPPRKYERSWTRERDFASERAFRRLKRERDLSGVPVLLVRHLAQVSVRAGELNERIIKIEREARANDGAMDSGTWQRWCYLVSEYRRFALAIATLSKSVFAEQRQQSDFDLVAAMAGPIETTASAKN